MMLYQVYIYVYAPWTKPFRVFLAVSFFGAAAVAASCYGLPVTESECAVISYFGALCYRHFFCSVLF